MPTTLNGTASSAGRPNQVVVAGPPWGHPCATLEGANVGIARARRTGEFPHESPGAIPSLDGQLMVAAEDEWIALQRLHVGGRDRRPDEVLRPPGLQLSGGVSTR